MLLAEQLFYIYWLSSIYLSGTDHVHLDSVSTPILQKKPALKDVYTLLMGKSAEWEDIGRAFGASLNDREELRKDGSLTDKGRLERILNGWLERDVDCTWGMFIEILSGGLGYMDIANSTREFLKNR